jgi:hypothetical protein
MHHEYKVVIWRFSPPRYYVKTFSCKKIKYVVSIAVTCFVASANAVVVPTDEVNIAGVLGQAVG